MTAPITPTFTPVIASATDASGVFPDMGVDEVGTDQPNESLTLGLIQAETGEPIQMETNDYIFEEGP